MPNQFISSSEKSIYLDTSFVLYALYESIDNHPVMIKETRQVLGLLLMRENSNCYISNIVLNEIFNVLERIGLQVYIDKQIIKLLDITELDWKGYTKDKRGELRYENEESVGLRIRDIKEWRGNIKYKDEYEALVTDEYENIIASLPIGIKCISNFHPEEKILKQFIETKKKYNKLDSNDINHYLLCKEHKIDGILTCDGDFKQIQDKEIKIIAIDPKFKLYK